jgi:tetratricopeptide (TPR) repeat protein
VRKLISSIVAFIILGGCASQPKPTTQATARTPATAPSGPAESYLALDEIEPRVKLADIVPTTRPSNDQPSLDAIELYARARGALVDGKRFEAIRLLERAIDADPYSFDLRYELAKVYAATNAKSDQAISAYEAAAKIDPDNTQLQTDLGRQYLGRDDLDKALTHLRLAVQTSEYDTDEDSAALADYYLARALQQKGYDRAAIDEYDRLLKRLSRPTLAIRGNPELAYVASHPEGLYLDVGKLYEKHHEYEQALQAYRFVAERVPETFENHARVVGVELAMGRGDQAVKDSLELVQRFRASSDSLALLRSVYKQLGREKDIVGELQSLHKAKPTDRGILFALADTLYEFDRRDDAAKLLSESLDKDPKSLDIFRKLFSLYESRDDTQTAAKVWIAYLTDHPESLTELAPLWEKLVRLSRKNSIRLTELQKLDVPPRQLGCKLYLVSRQALAWNRDALARASLEQATKQRPIFPAAFRAEINDIWQRQEWDKARKIAESGALVNAAKDAGDTAFAAELRGLSLLNQQDAKGAIDAFAEATKLGDPSPDLQYTYAQAVRAQGNEQRFEQLMWKLIGDRPGYEQAYNLLFNYYLDKNSGAQARKVLTTWRSADPTNVEARLLEARIMRLASTGRNSAQLENVEAILLDLFHDNADNAEVIGELAAYYAQTNRVSELVQRLEAERVRNPANRTAVESLVEIYAQQKKNAEAARVLDSAREAMGDDPDLLYYLAHLYERIDQPQMTEEILAKVIQIDPKHAAANNDLGYTWTDQGKNLDKAESMIRIAVDAEPDNESFLDSLGWVLYKRGNFGEARGFFERAIAPATFPDPVVLDHLGDTLYRLNENKLAQQRWQSAMDRIVAMAQTGMPVRDEVMKLRLVLIGKIKQAEQGKPITVAPTAAQEAAKEQAKN